LGSRSGQAVSKKKAQDRPVQIKAPDGRFQFLKILFSFAGKPSREGNASGLPRGSYDTNQVHMQLTAKLIQILPLQTGTGKNGEWKKQDIVVETNGQYPKKICISVWGDKINASQLVVGNALKVDFDIESREYNSRWYTDVKAWKVEVVGGSNTASDEFQVPNEEPVSGSGDDDIPF
jgi:hypothetical protein